MKAKDRTYIKSIGKGSLPCLFFMQLEYIKNIPEKKCYIFVKRIAKLDKM